MLMLVAGLDLRKPGMRQGQARRTCRSRFELDGDQRFNIAVVPAPGMHQTTVGHDFPIQAHG